MEDIKTNKTLVNVILDRSGSMQSTCAETISGYNSYLAKLREDKAIEYSLTMIQFDSPVDGPELTVKYVDKPLAEIADLAAADYQPRGMTPLYDAIGECVRRVETKDRSVLVVIITDGQENSSREFTAETIKALIKEKESQEHWTFTFLGADIDSYTVGATLGASFQNTTNYAKGMESNMYAAVADSTVLRSHTAATAGLRSAASFSMFNDTQRAFMGDPAVGKAMPTPTVTIPPAPPIAPAGGGPTASRPFRPPVSSLQRTSWKTSGEVSKP